MIDFIIIFYNVLMFNYDLFGQNSNELGIQPFFFSILYYMLIKFRISTAHIPTFVKFTFQVSQMARNLKYA